MQWPQLPVWSWPTFICGDLPSTSIHVCRTARGGFIMHDHKLRMAVAEGTLEELVTKRYRERR